MKIPGLSGLPARPPRFRTEGKCHPAEMPPSAFPRLKRTSTHARSQATPPSVSQVPELQLGQPMGRMASRKQPGASPISALQPDLPVAALRIHMDDAGVGVEVQLDAGLALEDDLIGPRQGQTVGKDPRRDALAGRRRVGRPALALDERYPPCGRGSRETDRCGSRCPSRHS